MSHQLYDTMAPIGQMHAHELAKAVDAMCQQACTHAAMAGALVAQGMSPSDAFHTVMAWEGAGMTVAPRMHHPMGMGQQMPAMGGHPGMMQRSPWMGMPR